MSAASAAFSISGHHLLVLVLRLLQLPFQKAGLGQELVVQCLLLPVVPFCLQKFGLWEGYLRQDMKYHWIVWDGLGFSPMQWLTLFPAFIRLFLILTTFPPVIVWPQTPSEICNLLRAACFVPSSSPGVIISLVSFDTHSFPPLPSHHHHDFHHLTLSPPCRQHSVLEAYSPTRSNPETKQMKFCIALFHAHLNFHFHCLPRSLYKRSHTLAPTLQGPPSPT